MMTGMITLILTGLLRMLRTRRKVLFVFVVLAHHRRRVVHVNVTDAPTAHWTAQEIVEAFPSDTPRATCCAIAMGSTGGVFSRRVHSLGIREVKTASRAPWQNPYLERLIGTLRRECLDHMVVLNETHLRRLLRDYVAYFSKTLSLTGRGYGCGSRGRGPSAALGTT